MNKEIRIYYESYEQAYHYIFPVIKKQFPDLDIKLVYLSKGKSSGYINNSKIFNILRFKNPDILISLVEDGHEFPLFVIEFSEAVITEDHELQRFDGYLGGVVGGCFYVKISPLKFSNKKHGGNIKFNIIEPYAIVFKKFKSLSFHIEWPLENSIYVKRDKNYFSCPPYIKELDILLTETIKYSLKEIDLIQKNGLSKCLLPILKKTELKTWIEEISNYEFLNDSNSFNSSRLKWLSKEKTLLFKFNRMGHGMDPERGMIWYYNNRYEYPITSRIIFPSTGDKIFESNKLENDLDYLKAFIYGTRLNKDKKFVEYLKINGYIKESKLTTNIINITDFVIENLGNLNKELFAIFLNSQRFLIQDRDENDRIILEWNINPDLFNQKSNYSATIISDRNYLEEDDVTYIVAHQVLKKNGFNIISISYPGAQGDRAILPQAGSGRKQERKYIDILSYYPNKFLDLMENKGSFVLKEVSEDIKKLENYRLKSNYKLALNSFTDRFSPESSKLPILLSVSFWLNKNNHNLKKLSIDKINFFVTISQDMKRWKIWIGGDIDIFKYKEGDVLMRKTFCVEK